MTPAVPPALDPAALGPDRGVGVLEALQGLLPAWAVAAFALVTHLGDTWLLVTLAALATLAYGRRAGGFVLGALLVGFAVTVAAKAWFGLPRPPTDLQVVAAYGLGFPSGHAIGATVGWGGLAVALERVATRRRRAAVAAAVVAAVAVSRVAIGVHYLVDVVVGVAVGLAVLGVATRWREEPLALFGLAGVLAAPAVVLTGAGFDALALLGAATGAVVTWQAVEPADRPWGARGVAAGIGGAVVLAAALAALEPGDAWAFGGGALVTTAILAAPALGERWFGARFGDGVDG